MNRDERVAQVSASLDRWEQIAGSGTFEDALDALEAIVALLDEGDLTLDLSVRCFETGTRLSERCQDLLEQAELRISILSPPSQYDEGDFQPEIDPWHDSDIS